jgi:hypothetical protein
MANFYDIHAKAIERAFNLNTRETNDYFRVIMWEPLASYDAAPENDAATIITFIRIGPATYEPASSADKAAIHDWDRRHRHSPSSAWELPDFSVDASTPPGSGK